MADTIPEPVEVYKSEGIFVEKHEVTRRFGSLQTSYMARTMPGRLRVLDDKGDQKVYKDPETAIAELKQLIDRS